MIEPKSGVYRAMTREAAETAYHADARAHVDEGYVPAAEDWSAALGQQVLTVRYVYAPEQAPGVLAALASAERESAAASPAPAAVAVAHASPTPSPQAVRSDSRLPLLALVAVGVATVYIMSGGLGGSPSPTQPGSGLQATQRAPTPLPTAKPWTLEVADAEYTTETFVGGSVFVTVTVKNLGQRANPAIDINFSELDKNADIRGCDPTCEIEDLPGFGPSAVFPGLKPGSTRVYEVEFVATTVGVVAWSVCVYDDHLLDGESVYCGDGRTTIR